MYIIHECIHCRSGSVQVDLKFKGRWYMIDREAMIEVNG